MGAGRTGRHGPHGLWADVPGLRGIQLDANALETRVVLRADKEIPHHIVSQSPDKIVIDLSTVDPNQSIPTDFSSAENIEQVIMKPIGADTLRLIIRGDHLGAAIIGMTRNVAANPVAHRVVYEGETAGPAMVAKPAQVAGAKPDGFAMTATAADASAPAVKADTAKAPEVDPLSGPTGANAGDAVSPDEAAIANRPLMANEDTDPDALPNSLGSGNTQPHDRGALVDTRHQTNTTQVEEEAGWIDNVSSDLNNIPGWFHKNLPGVDVGLVLRLIGLTALLIGLGVFLRHKLNGPDGMLSLNGRPSPGRGRGKSRSRRGLLPSTPSAGQPGAKQRQAAPSAERPVGLSRLNNAPAAHQPTQPVISPKLALDQYARQASPPAAQQGARFGTEIDRELQRSLQIRNAVHQTQRKPGQPTKPLTKTAVQPGKSLPPNGTAAKKPVVKPGLPNNNNDVLDFLRDVADLMEKDGKHNLADGIKKGISKRPL